MLDILKKQIYFSKMQLLFKKGLDQKRILPFDEEFLEKLDHTFVNGLPVSVYIKYLFGPGKCYDASLYMFYCFLNTFERQFHHIPHFLLIGIYHNTK